MNKVACIFIRSVTLYSVVYTKLHMFLIDVTYPFTGPGGSSALFLPAFLWAEGAGEGDDE